MSTDSPLEARYYELMNDARPQRDIDWGGIMFFGLIFAIVAGIGFLLWAWDPSEYAPYRCEDRGGIEQAVGDKYGDVRTLVCADGSIRDTQVQTVKGKWKWND